MGINSKAFVFCNSNDDPTGAIGDIYSADQTVTGSILMSFDIDESLPPGSIAKGQFVSQSISSTTISSESTQYTVDNEFSRLKVSENVEFLVKSGSSTIWKSVKNITKSDLVLSYFGTGIRGMKFWSLGEIVSESVSFDTISIDYSGSAGFFSSGSPPQDDSPFYYVRTGS